MSSMINSIQHFEEKIIPKLENEYLKNPLNLDEYVKEIANVMHHFELFIVQETLEMMDQMLQESQVRAEKWVVEAHKQKQLLTTLGNVTFQKTLFKNKQTGKCEYLLDKILGLHPHERITDGEMANALEEAVQTSYRRGGEEISVTTQVSKQTIKNKIHQLKFPKQKEQNIKKKEVPYLYLDADEDHVSLQFRETKGDLKKEKRQGKQNVLLVKIVYVYEGIEPEALKSKRHRLINPHYFCGVNVGEENIAFWDEIYEYIESHYDLSNVKKIYLNSDGGSWIKAGMKRIKGICHVLDGYHIKQSLGILFSDELEEEKEKKKEVIKTGTKEQVKGMLEGLKVTEHKARQKRKEEEKTYILSNFEAIKIRLN